MEVAERNRVVVGPLLEKLPDLVEKEARLDPSRASPKQRADSRDASVLLASLLNVAGPEYDTARAVVLNRVERSGRRATESFGSLHIRIPLIFSESRIIFSKFLRDSENSKTSQHFLECSAKSREKIIKI